MSNDLVVAGPVVSSDLNSFEDCLNAALSLKPNAPGNVDRATMILSCAARIDPPLTALQIDALVNTLRRSAGYGKKALLKMWKPYAEQAAKAREAEEHKKAQANAAAYAGQAQAVKDAEHKRLWASCSFIAESPDLLKGMTAVAHEIGVVHEDANVRAIYLTFSSRLLSDSVRILRTGASSGGKNFPIEKMLRFFPDGSVIQFSGGSPLSLPYYDGEDNTDALKHKAIYVQEASILNGKPGETDPFSKMFLILLSEGRIFYPTVRTDPVTGKKTTITVIKKGPIAAVMTSADEIDHQLKTRTLPQETDESGAQTVAIAKSILSKRQRRYNLQPWIDFQLLLELDMPVDGYLVDIPFREAIFEAFEKKRPGFLEASPMRMRRDLNGMIAAIEASALVHKLQRKTNEDGEIVADLVDYQHAYEAFDVGLSSAYGMTRASDNVIATVAVIEEMLTENENDLYPGSVKVTTKELAKRLRVASTSTAKERIDAAITYGAIEYNDDLTRRGGPGWFKVVVGSEDLRKGLGGGVFPTPDAVEFFFGGQNQKNSQMPENESKSARI
jgi:hypothetical protein